MLIHRIKKKEEEDKDDTYLCGWISDVLLKINSPVSKTCSGVKWPSNLEVPNSLQSGKNTVKVHSPES